MAQKQKKQQMMLEKLLFPTEYLTFSFAALLQEIKTSNKDKEVIDAIKELKDALTDRDSGSGGKYTPGL